MCLIGFLRFVCLFRRSRRQLAALSKDCQFGFPAEGEEPADLDTALAYYQLDDSSDAVFPTLPVRYQKNQVV